MVSGPSDSARLKSTLHFISPYNYYIFYNPSFEINLYVAAFGVANPKFMI